jgi:hypothetical protein
LSASCSSVRAPMITLASRALEVCLADVAELAAAAKRHRPEREPRDPQATTTQLPIFHVLVSSCCYR